jgi:hypothetical protein
MPKRFIQFPHPGGEHSPGAGGRSRWQHGNTAHKRKFMFTRGDYRVTPDGPSSSGFFTFWGEWEADSTAQPMDGPRGEGFPQWLQEPFLRDPPDHDPPQNTDPFVFGDRFLYTFCRQGKFSELRSLEPGSVILFGSYRGGGFCLDTCFVVAKRIPHTYASHRSALNEVVPSEFFTTTLEPMYGWARHDPRTARETFALYLGATVDEPVDGMFSFVPCLGADPEPHGFARPRLENCEVITPKLAMAIRANQQLAASRIPEFWRWTVDSVVGRGLGLGTRVTMPPRRP